jgi:hypothetical protein
MKSIRVLLVASLLVGVLSGCVANKTDSPTHKARASACLVTPAFSEIGSPQKQLAYDLVEAKVVYGLNAKEVRVPKASTDSQIDKLLFTSLKAGCVYFIATEPEISSRVSNFVGHHKYVVALLVGGSAPLTQPTNVRWIADDLASGAALAGFGAAAKTTTDNLYLVIQDGYFEHDQIIKSFTAGVNAYNQAVEKKIDLTVLNISNASEAESEIQDINPQVVLAVFAGKSIWKVLKDADREFLIGADLQLGNSDTPRGVFASVERNFNFTVLNTAKDMIEKRFYLDPVLADNNALADGLIELRPKDDTILGGTTADLLTAFKAQLVADHNN